MSTDPYDPTFQEIATDAPAEEAPAPASSPETSAPDAGEPLIDANLPAGSDAAAPAGGTDSPDPPAETPPVETPPKEEAAPAAKPTYEELQESARYWQSQHDKKTAEMQGELEELRMFRPVVEAINARPELMRTIADAMEDGAPTGGTNGQAALDIQVPDPPTPPEDPFSEEGEGYNKKLFEWAKKLSESQKASVAAIQQSQQQAAQTQEQNRLMNEALSEAQHRYHLPQDKASQLISELSQDGQAIVRLFGSIDAYVEQKYRSRQPSTEDIRQREALESARRQQEQRTTPLATGAQGGDQPSQGQQFAGYQEGIPDPFES